MRPSPHWSVYDVLFGVFAISMNYEKHSWFSPNFCQHLVVRLYSCHKNEQMIRFWGQKVKVQAGPNMLKCHFHSGGRIQSSTLSSFVLFLKKSSCFRLKHSDTEQACLHLIWGEGTFIANAARELCCLASNYTSTTGQRLLHNKQESPAVADKPARRLRKVFTIYVRAVGLL